MLLSGAGAISVLNTYYGRGDLAKLPIGAYNVNTTGAVLEMEDPLPYVPLLGKSFPSIVKNTSSPGVEDAVSLYRRVLAAQPHRSVAISSIGIHTNLAGTIDAPMCVADKVLSVVLLIIKIE